MNKASKYFICSFLFLVLFFPVLVGAENSNDNEPVDDVNENINKSEEPEANTNQPQINTNQTVEGVNTNETEQDLNINQDETLVNTNADEPQSKEKKKKEIKPADFGLVSQPLVLPDNPFYFVKDWWRGLKVFFTFDQLRKEELRGEQLNQRLLDVEELFNQPADPKSQAAIKKALDKYQKESVKIKTGIEKVKEKVKNSDQVDKLIEKTTTDGLQRDYLLNKLEQKTGLQESVKQEIRNILDGSANSLAGILLLLDDSAKIEKALNQAVDTGSVEQRAYNIQALKNLEQKMINSLSSLIEKIRQRSRESLKKELERSETITSENLMNELINSK